MAAERKTHHIKSASIMRYEDFDYNEHFKPEEVAEFKRLFGEYDRNGDNTVDVKEMGDALKRVGEYQSEEQVKALIAEVDADKSGALDFAEFLWVIYQVKKGRIAAPKALEKIGMITVKGMAGLHSFSPEEMSAFSEHLNNMLGSDPECKYLLPISPTGTDLCAKVRDGVLLCKFINIAVPNTIDMRVLNLRRGSGELSLFQVNENLNLAISSSKSIGAQTINIGATELIHGAENPHIVLGLVWQLVKIQLLNSINLSHHPELFRLLEPGEELSDLLRLPPEQLLLRWFNFHLKNAGWHRRVNNFAGDVKDSENYTVLLAQIAPGRCDKAALSVPAQKDRAELVLANARKLGVPTFIKSDDIVAGNSRLNLAFTASIFNTCPGLDPMTDAEKLELAGMMSDDVGDSREERAFRMWINSLNIPGVYINSLFEDCKDGLVLLKVMEYIKPGVVNWSMAEMKPVNKFKRLQNCNYAVTLGKGEKLKFSLVGIGGVDLETGNKKLTLALVWQMMRSHTLSFLERLRVGGKSVDDSAILEWANHKVAASGKTTTMKSFQDSTLATSHFLIDLLAAVESRIINWDLVTPAATPEDKLLNARYAISIARKLGCTIFLLPEDIVECKPKMILTFVAAIMALGK
jgi:plastin-1